MKQCTYCGGEQPDEATICPIDHEPLVPKVPRTPDNNPYSAYTQTLRQALADGKTLDQAFGQLRVAGAHIGQCVFAVVMVQRCSTREAQKLVYSSAVWAAEAKKIKNTATMAFALGISFLTLGFLPPFAAWHTVLFGMGSMSFVIWFKYAGFRIKAPAKK